VIQWIRKRFRWLGVTIYLVATLSLLSFTRLPQTDTPTAFPTATAADLIRVTNQVRTGNGLKALTVNSILMGTAQWTADYMAENHLQGHIGGVRERVMAAGYGGGVAAWATENIMMGHLTAEEIVMQAWADDIHSIPVSNPIYCDVGAGVAVSDDGEVYYVLHAAYSDNRMCGPYIGPGGATLPGPSGATDASGTPLAWSEDQLIYTVHTVTPQPDGSVVHVVKPGQSLWSIAIAYGVKIKDLLAFNHLPADYTTIYTGQKLKIPVTVVARPAQLLSPTPAARLAAETRRPAPRSTPSSALLPSATATPQAEPAGKDQIIRTAILSAVVLGMVLILVGLFLRK